MNIENHKIGNLYTMDGLPDRWEIVYYPLSECGKTGKKYDEPRALVQNIDKPGFWWKEVPLRYLTRQSNDHIKNKPISHDRDWETNALGSSYLLPVLPHSLNG